MIKHIRLWMLILIVPVLAASPSFSADYLSTIKEAITNVELGAYERAAPAAERAIALNDSDPLGHLTLGVIYMHTSRLDDASREFKLVSAVRPDDWRPYYGLGVIAVSTGHPQEAKTYFAKAGRLSDGEAEVSGVNDYLSSVTKGWSTSGSNHSDETTLAEEALGVRAFKSGDLKTAFEELSKVLEASAPLGFEENQSPLATFDPSHPVALPKGKLSWKPETGNKIPVVSGSLTLKADTSKTTPPSFVTFYVDDVMAGVTNYSPFEFDWNTTRYSNGIHQLRIEAKNASGGIISNKTVKIRISNSDSERSDATSPPGSEAMERQVWNSMRISENRKLAHYYMAKIYLASGNKDRAEEQLEYALAYQPDFQDARELMKKVRAFEPYKEIYKGKTGSAKIALTFDDGPNERTEQLLEVLRRLHVHATFFVVGFMAEAHPDVVKEMQADGHQIENHTYNHQRLTTYNVSQTELELAKGAAVIRAITGRPSRFFRPPGGHSTAATRTAAQHLGLTGVFWSILCSPYEGDKYRQLADHVINNAHDGSVVLMHNGEPGTMSSLPKIVSTLRSRGYEFATISELDHSSR